VDASARVLLDEGGVGGSTSLVQSNLRNSLQRYLFSRGSHRVDMGSCHGKQKMVVVDTTDVRSLAAFRGYYESQEECPPISVLVQPTQIATTLPERTGWHASKTDSALNFNYLVDGCQMTFSRWATSVWPSKFWPASTLCLYGESNTFGLDYTHMLASHDPYVVIYLFPASASLAVLQAYESQYRQSRREKPPPIGMDAVSLPRRVSRMCIQEKEPVEQWWHTTLTREIQDSAHMLSADIESGTFTASAVHVEAWDADPSACKAGDYDVFRCDQIVRFNVSARHLVPLA